MYAFVRASEGSIFMHLDFRALLTPFRRIFKPVGVRAAALRDGRHLGAWAP